MALNSINTNVGAMVALQSLNAVNRELFETQRRISTGLRIASAKDDGATWAIAQRQRADLSALDAVKDSLNRGIAVVDVALAAGESISDLLVQMKSKMLAASEAGLSSFERAALSEDYAALRRQIDIAAANASFGKTNLISAGSTGQIRALANARGDSTIDIDHVDLSTTGDILSVLPATLTGTVTATQLAEMSDAIDGVSTALAKLGTGAKSLERHLEFVEKQQDVLEASIGRLVDADIAKEAARLQALQVKQQLAIMALSIANRAPWMLLQLFQSYR